MILSSDSRLLIGINIEDLYDKPYIATWLQVFSSFYRSDSGVTDEKKKLNLARFFFAEALAIRLHEHDSALIVKPSLFYPQPANEHQSFSEGALSCINLNIIRSDSAFNYPLYPMVTLLGKSITLVFKLDPVTCDGITYRFSTGPDSLAQDCPAPWQNGI
jgi:hypothetical protein